MQLGDRDGEPRTNLMKLPNGGGRLQMTSGGDCAPPGAGARAAVPTSSRHRRGWHQLTLTLAVHLQHWFVVKERICALA